MTPPATRVSHARAGLGGPINGIGGSRARPRPAPRRQAIGAEGRARPFGTAGPGRRPRHLPSAAGAASRPTPSPSSRGRPRYRDRGAPLHGGAASPARSGRSGPPEKPGDGGTASCRSRRRWWGCGSSVEHVCDARRELEDEPDGGALLGLGQPRSAGLSRGICDSPGIRPGSFSTTNGEPRRDPAGSSPATGGPPDSARVPSARRSTLGPITGLVLTAARRCRRRRRSWARAAAGGWRPSLTASDSFAFSARCSFWP